LRLKNNIFNPSPEKRLLRKFQPGEPYPYLEAKWQIKQIKGVEKKKF